MEGLQNTLWSAVERSSVTKTRKVREYVNAHGPGGGSFEDIEYPIPGTINDVKTNSNTVKNLRRLTLRKIENNPNRNPKKTPESYILRPEDNSLSFRGAGRDSDDREQDLRNLLGTGEVGPTNSEVEKLLKETVSAVESVVNDINGAR